MMKKATTTAPRIYGPSSKIHSKRQKSNNSLLACLKKTTQTEREEQSIMKKDKENFNSTQNQNIDIYKPHINRKKSQNTISCQNAVSLMVEEDIHAQQSLLDSLLYEQKQDPIYDSLVISGQVMMPVEEQQNLLDSCEQEGYFSQLSQQKNQSPCHSDRDLRRGINVFSSHKRLVEKSLQKSLQQSFNTEQKISNCLKIERVKNFSNKFKIIAPQSQQNQLSQQKKQKIVLVRRLESIIKQNPVKLLNFFIKIHESLTLKDLQNNTRKFLFQNSIIFNKNQLNQFLSLFCSESQNNDEGSTQLYSSIKIGQKLEEIFISSLPVCQNQNSFIQIYDQRLLMILFPQKKTKKKQEISLWKMVEEIFRENEEKMKTLQQSMSSSRLKNSRFSNSFSNSFYQQSNNSGRKQKSQTASMEQHLKSIGKCLSDLYWGHEQKQVEYKIKITCENPKKLI